MKNKLLVNIKSLLFVFHLFIICACSWEIMPFARNHTNEPLFIRIKSKSGFENNIKVYSAKGILPMHPKNKYEFTDTLTMARLDSLTGLIELPAVSTSMITMPYKWRSEDYEITLESKEGTELLDQDIAYKVVTKSGKELDEPVAFKKQILYFDIR